MSKNKDHKLYFQIYVYVFIMTCIVDSTRSAINDTSVKFSLKICCCCRVDSTWLHKNTFQLHRANCLENGLNGYYII